MPFPASYPLSRTRGRTRPLGTNLRGLAGSATDVLGVQVCFDAGTDVRQIIKRIAMAQAFEVTTKRLEPRDRHPLSEEQVELLIRCAEQTTCLIVRQLSHVHRQLIQRPILTNIAVVEVLVVLDSACLFAPRIQARARKRDATEDLLCSVVPICQLLNNFDGVAKRLGVLRRLPEHEPVVRVDSRLPGQSNCLSHLLQCGSLGHRLKYLLISRLDPVVHRDAARLLHQTDNLRRHCIHPAAHVVSSPNASIEDSLA